MDGCHAQTDGIAGAAGATDDILNACFIKANGVQETCSLGRLFILLANSLWPHGEPHSLQMRMLGRQAVFTLESP